MEATHIEVEAEVRYWEDATVNDVEDADGNLIYGRKGDAWRVWIDLRTGRIEGWPPGMVARIHYKVCDQGEYWLTDAAGTRLAKWGSYYVPDALCLGAFGHGDYIFFKVGPNGLIADYQRPHIDESEWAAIPKETPHGE